MNCRHWKWWSPWGCLLLVATTIGPSSTGSMAMGQESPATDGGVSRALLFAPGDYLELADTDCHTRGATALAARLKEAGFAHNAIRTFSGATGAAAATASNLRKAVAEVVDAAEADDVLVIYLATHVVKVGDLDYICCADTPRGAIEGLLSGRSTSGSGSASQNVPPTVQELVRQLALSASSRRCLLIDATATPATAAAKQLPRAARARIAVGQGQWIVWGDPAPANTPATSSGLSHFTHSVVDGLAGYADANQDREVSLLEFVDYLQALAESSELPAPKLYGKANADFCLAHATKQARMLVPANSRDYSQILMLGCTPTKSLLLLERNGPASLMCLERLLSLSASSEWQSELREMRATANALVNPENLLAEVAAAQKEGRSVLVPAPAGLALFQAAAAGSYYRNYGGTTYIVTEDPYVDVTPSRLWIRADRVEERRVHVAASFVEQLETGSFRLVKSELPEGWLDADSISGIAETEPLASRLEGVVPRL